MESHLPRYLTMLEAPPVSNGQADPCQEASAETEDAKHKSECGLEHDKRHEQHPLFENCAMITPFSGKVNYQKIIPELLSEGACSRCDAGFVEFQTLNLSSNGKLCKSDHFEPFLPCFMCSVLCSTTCIESWLGGYLGDINRKEESLSAEALTTLRKSLMGIAKPRGNHSRFLQSGDVYAYIESHDRSKAQCNQRHSRIYESFRTLPTTSTDEQPPSLPATTIAHFPADPHLKVTSNKIGGYGYIRRDHKRAVEIAAEKILSSHSVCFRCDSPVFGMTRTLKSSLRSSKTYEPTCYSAIERVCQKGHCESLLPCYICSEFSAIGETCGPEQLFLETSTEGCDYMFCSAACIEQYYSEELSIPHSKEDSLSPETLKAITKVLLEAAQSLSEDFPLLYCGDVCSSLMQPCRAAFKWDKNAEYWTGIKGAWFIDGGQDIEWDFSKGRSLTSVPLNNPPPPAPMTATVPHVPIAEVPSIAPEDKLALSERECSITRSISMGNIEGGIEVKVSDEQQFFMSPSSFRGL